MKIDNWSQTPDFAQLEEQIANYWDADQTFQKSVDFRPADHAYVFYDGPPFATGLPHYGHLLGSTSKDVIPRYWTMKGYRVERRWGWDCHGVPIENMIEKELDLKGGKKGIETYGIAKFNEACRAAILRFDKEWEVIIRRLGRWVDFKNSYKTMDKTFMESVWWGFAEMYKKGLVYQGRRVLLYCPRCATPLSNFEIAMDNSYKDVEDNSVWVKFKLKDQTGYDRPTYFLAWTTTPWTLPGNVALAVLPEAEYSLVEIDGQNFWVAHEKVGHVAKLKNISHPTVVKSVKGAELADLEYEPLYTYMPLDGKKAHYMTTADFVSLEDGSGVVHTAAIFGEDDYALAVRKDLPRVPTLDDEGKFLPIVEPLAGTFYKKGEQWVIDDLQSRGLLFHAEKYTHSYPFCYRCGTPLYYNALPAWFIDIQQIKQKLSDANESINWFPDYLKHGRFGKGIETAPDWNVSRSRYWGTPMPIWRGMKDGQEVLRIVSSLHELQQWAVDPKAAAKVDDLHRHFIDDLEVWVDDDKTVKGKRTPEVFDCWVESGSMPFAAMHYPFENKTWFEHNYPAQFISEYIAQTRAWFYCMHALSVALFDKPSFQNALTTGTILAEDGNKMSKSKKNYPDPMLVINKYGVDSLRLYLMSSVVMKGDNLNFSEKEVGELRKKVFVIWWNMLSFYHQYAAKSGSVERLAKPKHVMDEWLLTWIDQLTQQVTKQMDGYDVVKASRLLIAAVNTLSTWYLRLSRDRIKDDAEAAQAFGFALTRLAQLFAPVTPFFSELAYQSLMGDKQSVHLSDWPEVAQKVDETLLNNMEEIMKAVEATHAERKQAGIKLQQPLAKVTIQSSAKKPAANLLEVLAQEVNVKQVVWETADVFTAALDTVLTNELREEGEARAVIRTIQQLRKNGNIQINDSVDVELPTWPKAWEKQIKAKAKVKNLTKGEVAKLV